MTWLQSEVNEQLARSVVQERQSDRPLHHTVILDFRTVYSVELITTIMC